MKVIFHALACRLFIAIESVSELRVDLPPGEVHLTQNEAAE